MLNSQQLNAAQGLTRQYVCNGHLPLATMVIADQQGVQTWAAYGLGGEEQPELYDRQFALASISKAITGILVARLYEQGVLDYDAPVVEYIPEYGTSASRRSTRLGQIFNHSTGAPSRFIDACAEVEYKPDGMLALLCNEELQEEPGTRSRYTTHTFQLINEAIKRRLDLSMEQALQQYVCEPCGLTATSFYPDPILALPVVDHPVAEGAAYEAIQHMEMAGGGLWSTLADLQALGQAWLTLGKLVSEETFAKVTSLQPGLPIVGDESTLSRRTLGWDRSRQFKGQPEYAFYHGGATGTMLYLDPQRQLVFVLLANRWASGNDHAFEAVACLYS